MGKVIVGVLSALVMVSCATADCSVYKKLDSIRCVCIRDNGDSLRANRCAKVVTKHKLKKLRQSCYRKCFDDCGKCEEIR